MALHIPTLLVVSIFVFCLMGLLILHAWSRETVAGPVVWLLLYLIPAFRETLALRVSVYSFMAAGYGALTFSELWRGRHSLEVSYLPAMLLTALHTLFYCVCIFSDQALELDQALAGKGSGIPFFSFMLIESMLYVIGISYVTLAMVKERAELRLKAAAYSDALTGIGNRRAFMLNGEQMLADCKRRRVCRLAAGHRRSQCGGGRGAHPPWFCRVDAAGTGVLEREYRHCRYPALGP